MHEYQKDPNYLEALKFSNIYKTEDFKGELGFNYTIVSSSAEKILIAQNNTLIALVTKLHIKLQRLEDRISQVEKYQPSSSNQRPSQPINLEIDDLVDKFTKKLTLDTKGKKKVTNYEFAVYKQ